jgi:hypothetical protein
MAVLNSDLIYRDNKLGIRVDRDTDTIPQTTTEALFTVVGGRVAITQIIGEVTTAIQNQANNTKLISNPTNGTDVDLCDKLDIAADEKGTLYGITGISSDALIGVNAGALRGQTVDVIVPPGTIDLNCAASNSGAVKWTLFYYPIDVGAYVEAA